MSVDPVYDMTQQLFERLEEQMPELEITEPLVVTLRGVAESIVEYSARWGIPLE